MARKKKALAPKRKRMTRQARLSSARDSGWVEKYTGNRIIHGYAKWFAVDALCAMTELRLLGVAISPEQEAGIRASLEARTPTKRPKGVAVDAPQQRYPDSDDTFAYIAGYTAGGVRYGTTWEKAGEEPPGSNEEW